MGKPKIKITELKISGEKVVMVYDRKSKREIFGIKNYFEKLQFGTQKESGIYQLTITQKLQMAFEARFYCLPFLLWDWSHKIREKTILLKESSVYN